MALGGVYQTGTITIGTDKLTVTGVGTLWGPIAEVGDWILCAGQIGMVAIVNGDTVLTLQSQWQGTLPSAAVYVLIKMSWLRYDPALTQAKLRELLAALDAQGTFLFVETPPPDPALGQDGQWALQTNQTPWQVWFKTGGVWVQQTTPAGLAWKGAWVSTTTYKPADAVQYTGQSYVGKTASNINKPPATSPSDWDLMAASGATGPTGPTGSPGMVWRGNWSSSTAYVVNDGVANAGNSYICVIAHAATATPPPTANWNLTAQGGTTTIADSQIDPIKLNSDNATEQHLFRDRLNFVARDGDTMQGDLTISKTYPQIFMADAGTTAATSVDLTAKRGGFNRWLMRFGVGAESASPGVGSDFGLLRADNAGNFLDSPLAISRATGIVTASGLVSYGAPQVLSADTPPQTMGQRAQARQNIYAAPFDALAFNGLQVNGSCEINQDLEGDYVSVGTNTTPQHVMDSWKITVGGTTGMFGQQLAAPANNYGFQKCMQITAGVAYPMGASDYVFASNLIEGYRCVRLNWGTPNAQPISIGFWVATTVAGVAAILVRNGQAAIGQTFSCVGGGVPEYKRVTFPGDITDTWNKTNGIGIEVMFSFNCGSNYALGGPNSWTTWPTLYGVAGQTNFFATSSNLAQVFGLIVVPGTELPDPTRSHFIMRSLDRELITCQRYYTKSYDAGIKAGSTFAAGGEQLTVQVPAGANFGQSIKLPFMRAAPTLTFWDAAGTANKISYYTGTWNNGGTIVFSSAKQTAFYIQTTIASAVAYSVAYRADARL